MGKGRISSKSNNDSVNSGNGGIMNSGIFGMFGSTVHCDANNNSFYCSITKLVNLIIMFFFLAMVVYLLYVAYNYFTKGKKIMARKR
jgi:hypothetical protein